MTFAGTPKLESGLAHYEPDYYAILGVPLNADQRLIRKGYLNTAKQLHPDRYIGQSDKRETANWLFSKLISPASEVLNREKDRVEYREVLRLRAKRLLSLPPSEVWPQSTYVDTLLNAADLETQYSDTILNLAAHQYKDLDKSLACTEELSKLNLAYLLLSNGFKVAAPSVSAPRPTPTTAPTAASSSSADSRLTRSPKTTQLSVNPHRTNYASKPAQPAPSAPTSSAPISSAQASTAPPRSAAPPAPEPEPVIQASKKRYEQAKNMMARKQYKKAIQFLNIAIADEPDNADYYYERGLAHQKNNNSPRARQDFQRALKLDPKHDKAAAKLNDTGKKTVSAGASNRSSTQQASSSRSQPQPEPAKKGMFGRLFSR
ncbi:MAG: DnaJ domain-containing protein [Cyanobacteria bacterium P01_A01_bin.3]